VIVLSLNTKGYQGLVRKTATVITNDPKNYRVRLILQARIKVPISLEPKAAVLQGFKGDDISRVVTITAHEERPLALQAVSLSLPDKVSYELKTVEEGRVYQVVMRNMSKEADRYKGLFTLKTNYPEKPYIAIRIFGQIRGNLQARPESLDFQLTGGAAAYSSKSNMSAYKRSVLISLQQGNNLKIGKVEINRSRFEVDVEEIEKGKSYRFDVRLLPGTVLRGRTNDQMIIYTNSGDNQVIRVPITIRAR
jgi:hypothetical protein